MDDHDSQENRPERLTTASGSPIADNQNALSAGRRGPLLMQDWPLLEKHAHFNRERIPERVVHAVGSGAYGYFDVTNPDGVSGGPGYPGYMWEFPCDSTDAECLGTGILPSGHVLSDYMGETWSEPIITRVRVTVNCSVS